MKNYVIFLLTLFIPVGVMAVNIEDESIIKELEQNKVEQLEADFSLQEFSSCENLENVMGDYIKKYWEANKDNYNYPVLYRKFGSSDLMEDSMAVEESVSSSSDSLKGSSEISSGGGSDDFSETNVQIAGVDESDIIKTDGEYIYYYNKSDKFVYIVKAYPTSEAKVVKKLKIPKNFNNPVLYIEKNRLVIVSSGWSDGNYSERGYWINRNTKTYTIVFDTTNIEKPKLIKLYISDGNVIKTRKIGDYVYVLSNNHFGIPYHTFKSAEDVTFDASMIIPKQLELTKTADTSEQNLKLKGKDYPYHVSGGNISKCNEIEYVLPDVETLKNFDFAPSYNMISVINIKDVEETVKTKVIAGNNSEIFMSLENLYLTSPLYQSHNFSCPAGARCFAPWFPRGNNTLVHKINVEGRELSYQDSTIVPGSPLNQYSMDENDGKFRIITQKWDPQETSLYILDEKMDLMGSLTGLGKGENFQSSRFIDDKLFLVTFKQVDPLFAIDVADPKDPKILGELKIPGFSTYLHPYDDNHLIGLGYDTTENQWGGTVRNGIKLDLYEINYDKKCGDSNLSDEENKKCDAGDYKGIIVKQQYTKTFGDNRSYSEALNNPRLFMWKASDNNLLLPITLYKNAKNDIYRSVDFFQGLVSININKDTGITENYRMTHIDTSKIEEDRLTDCKRYTVDSEELECKILLDGTTYCPSKNRSYVPPHCYADSTIGEFLASRSYNYRESFVNRALWIGNNVYSVSDDEIRASDINTGIENKSVELKGKK